MAGMCSMEATPRNRKAQKWADIADAKITSDGRRALYVILPGRVYGKQSPRTSTPIAKSADEKMVEFLGRCDNPTAMTVS